MPEWTDELKDKVVKDYLAKEPTPENSMEIVQEIAAATEGRTANSIRMILTQAKVYIKKTPSTSKTSTESTSKRISKADAVAALTAAITDAGADPDPDILDKMTGKAAQYFTSVIKHVSKLSDEDESVDEPED